MTSIEEIRKYATRFWDSWGRLNAFTITPPIKLIVSGTDMIVHTNMVRILSLYPHGEEVYIVEDKCWISVQYFDLAPQESTVE